VRAVHPIYRDLELMLADRGVAVAHTTLFRCWGGRPPTAAIVPR
jgi:transposase-like protein